MKKMPILALGIALIAFAALIVVHALNRGWFHDGPFLGMLGWVLLFASAGSAAITYAFGAGRWMHLSTKGYLIGCMVMMMGAAEMVVRFYVEQM